MIRRTEKCVAVPGQSTITCRRGGYAITVTVHHATVPDVICGRSWDRGRSSVIALVRVPLICVLARCRRGVCIYEIVSLVLDTTITFHRSVAVGQLGLRA